MAVLEGIATAVVAAAVKRWVGESDLVADLGKTLASAGAGKAEKELADLLKGKGRGAAITKALQAAMASVEAEHVDFVKTAGGFDWHFLAGQAGAGELAKVFVVGEAPDSGLVAEAWVESWMDIGEC